MATSSSVEPQLASTDGASHPQKIPEPVYHRKFGSRAKAMEVLEGVDLAGRTVLITGTTTGIGIETARALFLHGAHLVMANRNVELSEQLREKLYAELGDARKAEIDIIQLDLALLESVKKAAEEFLTKEWPLHVLVLNAGVFNSAVPASVDGYETTFAVNHLGHFYLAHLLMEKLRDSSPSRLVIVSSLLHRNTGMSAHWPIEKKLERLIPDADVASQRRGRIDSMTKPWRLYATSKLCNVLMAFKIHRDEGNDIRVHTYAVHPGSIMTGIQRNTFLQNAPQLMKKLVSPLFKSIEQGAATTVYCAGSPDVENDSGKYYENCWEEENHLHKVLAHDEQLQDALWEKSMEMIRKFEEKKDEKGQKGEDGQ